jgi:hypothetical protein
MFSIEPTQTRRTALAQRLHADGRGGMAHPQDYVDGLCIFGR